VKDRSAMTESISSASLTGLTLMGLIYVSSTYPTVHSHFNWETVISQECNDRTLNLNQRCGSVPFVGRG
jgi:hypothetical protein